MMLISTLYVLHIFHIFTFMNNAKRIAEMKVDLIQRLLAIEDRAVLDEISVCLQNAADHHANWYENLDDEDKASITRGEADFDEGKFSEQDEMIERIKADRGK
jgi:predicted transcriptional regulator